MGELLDSSDSRASPTAAYNKRVKSYLAVARQLGRRVGDRQRGQRQLDRAATPRSRPSSPTAYNDVTSAGKRSALTLYYNIGCGDGPAELDPIAFTEQYVPAAARNGLDYVLLSYYEGDCKGIRPSAGTWTTYFARLHDLYPHAQLGFGEIGMDQPATTSTLGTARSLMTYYYGLDIALPYYVGGYFWWYYDEDCLPLATKPLWATLQTALASEAAALSH